LGLVALSACAQGVQDTPAGQDNVDFGGSGDTGGSSGSVGSSGSSSASAGHGGSVVGAAGMTAFGGSGSAGKGGTTGSAGKGGTTGSAGKGGTTGSAGQASGGSGGTVANGGKGGTTGTGGSTSGGSTSGGSTGSGGSVSGNGVTAQYKVVSGNAMSSYIQCELYVLNAGPNTYAVSDLKVRYYYTDDVKTTTDWSLNWSHISTGGANQNVTVTEASMAMVPTKPNADTYFEFSFAPAGQSTIGPGQGIAFSWRFNASTQSLQYTQTNDYSFDASKTTQADWSHIVVLQNGTVIWGATP
jgi:hypothetical protein